MYWPTSKWTANLVFNFLSEGVEGWFGLVNDKDSWLLHDLGVSNQENRGGKSVFLFALLGCPWKASPAAGIACGGLRLTARLWLFRLQLAIPNGLPGVCVLFSNPKVRPISTEGFA